MALKIALIAHGRFHAFDLGKSLLARGHDVHLFTDYPGWAVARFGFPAARVTSMTRHGVAVRVLNRLERLGIKPDLAAFMHRWFGRWAARRIARLQWDVVYVWSSVAEEVLQAACGHARHRWLVRESSHIRFQHALLSAEEQRTGVRQDKPHGWSMAREQREYALADRIVVTSSFSRNSFVAEGIAPARTLLLRAGVRAELFRADVAKIRARQQRLLSGGPLRVLYVGTLCFRKGLSDLIAVIRVLPQPQRFRFQFIGNVMPEVRALVDTVRDRAAFFERLPEAALVERYADNDVFVIPTIEDGGPFVLVQALAAGLICVASSNCLGPDLITDQVNGFLLPIRDPQGLEAVLEQIERDRPAAAEMVERAAQAGCLRNWDDAARDFEQAVADSDHAAA